jgi:hypothetical protein
LTISTENVEVGHPEHRGEVAGDPCDPAIALPIILSTIVTIGLQLWRSNLVLSLAGGTGVHVALATAIAAGLG